jgi:hypothetical protein
LRMRVLDVSRLTKRRRRKNIRATTSVASADLSSKLRVENWAWWFRELARALFRRNAPVTRPVGRRQPRLCPADTAPMAWQRTECGAMPAPRAEGRTCYESEFTVRRQGEANLE